jgi:2-oxoglutarate dehydrogenase E1 component
MVNEMDPSSQLPNISNLSFVEELLDSYQSNPESVSPEWRSYLSGLVASNGNGSKKYSIGPTFRPSPIFSGGYRTSEPTQPTFSHETMMIVRQDWLDQLLRAFRRSGHYAAQIDPLGEKRTPPDSLDPASYGFSPSDWDLQFSVDTLAGQSGPQVMTLRQIMDKLRTTYCRSIGVEYMHIDNPRARRWLQERMEQSENRIVLSRAEQLRILTRLIDAVVFEDFLAKRYPGKKTFSLKGAESLIPLLDLAIEYAGDRGVEQIMVAMAHRGRLNVLANILGKDPMWIFRELDDPDSDIEIYRGRGDVKYHLGYSRDIITSTDFKVHVSLCFNPSHLEFVNPVALGRVRAMQDRINDVKGERELPILIHGDAAFIGEGVSQETFNLSMLPAYSVGGTIHVIINNQIGFTTPEQQARSTTYTTDIAKMLPIPIFHVNGEDPEAVAQVVRLALDFRKEFSSDVVIDMYCYRYHGHNETDEPFFTQPMMYRRIRARKPVLDSYLDHLVQHNGVTLEEASRLKQEREAKLENKINAARSPDFVHDDHDKRLHALWRGQLGGLDAQAPEAPTGMTHERLRELLERLVTLPAGFTPHKTIQRWLQQRRDMIEGTARLDWSAAEALAFASLATDPVKPTRVRMTGQDCERGTFSHRHARLHDFNTGESFMPLQNLEPGQAPVEIVNSPLSEVAVLGFEWGYSLKMPDALVIWEAQFGDFCNAAQVIIDQFISSAEDKWRLLSGLVMLLPHGFEGAGPEHSSARLERFLALAAEDNIQVVNLTTPAQYFHCLRRQVLRPYRKPLVVMTPKSLLRDPESTSTLDDLANGRFQRVIGDSTVDPSRVSRILLCSGKVYFDLERYRKTHHRNDVAIVRLEQLYPLAEGPLVEALKDFPEGTPVFWVQEEPKNMGAWYFLNVQWRSRVLDRFPFSGIYRPESASPATGSFSSHKKEQEELVQAAFGTE